MKPELEVHDVPARAATLTTIDLARKPTYEEAMASMRTLSSFNGCLLQLASFAGRPPWEWHPLDELVYVLEGRATIELLSDVGDATAVELGAGSLVVVPARTWHRSCAVPRVTVLVATAKEGNRSSSADDPRGEGR